MIDITRPELDAKLEAAEARMDARATRLESKMDAVISELHFLRVWFAGLIATVVVAAIGTVVGVYGANASIMQSVIAGFQAGQASQALHK